MIGLSLRLTFNGGKEAIVRLVIIAMAVALGVGMLLIALAGINAVNTQNARYSWLETGSGPSPSAAINDPAAAPKDPLWWMLSADMFKGRLIGRIDVAETGTDSPGPPPGLTRLPGPGQFYASPALSKLLRSTPAGQLGARYPGQQVGTIGPAGLPAPDSLIIVIGRSAKQLSRMPDAAKVTRISTTAPSNCKGACYNVGIDANGIVLVLAVAAAALLFPVFIFIGTATRLSAARREVRFAAMRLVGATPNQVSVIAAVESTVAASAGVGVGFGLFYALRPALATISFTGARFYPADLSLSPIDVLLVALGVPVAAAIAARLALRRVTISPLGVSRRVTPKPPRARRLLPLALGIGELTYFVFAGRPAGSGGQTEAYLTGILLMMAGLVIAGPWLVMVGARLMARRTGRASVLIAARRLADNPQAGFRAVSGLVLALFVASVAIGIITTIDAHDTGGASSPAERATLVNDFDEFPASGPPITSTPSISAVLLTKLRSIHGVRTVALVHEDTSTGQPFPPGLVSCDQLAGIPALGRCAKGSTAAELTQGLGGNNANETPVWPPAHISVQQLTKLPVQSIVVETDGSTAAIEQARTTVELAYPHVTSPATLAEDRAQNANIQLRARYQQLVDVVILASLAIAGCSLAVSVAAGLSDRKRPFSLLRLTGAPLSMLRRVVALESAVPLLVVSAFSTGVGFLAAGLFVRSQLSEPLRAPGGLYYVIVAAGLVASLAVIASTLPLLERITGPETARSD